MEQSGLTPHAAIARRMRELRKGRGWSAERLAEEMRQVGIPWQRMVVTKLELAAERGTAMRAISVEEFLALAYVLSVAPIHLLVPPTGEDDLTRYAVTPHTDSVPFYARAWIRGLAPMGGQDPRRYFSEVPEEEWHPPGWDPATIERYGAYYDRKKGAADDGR